MLAQKGMIVTWGVKPSHVETGYGYIRQGEPVEGGYAVAAFREKPRKAKCQAMLAEGGWWWNSGMFCLVPALLGLQLELIWRERLERWVELLKTGKRHPPSEPRNLPALHFGVFRCGSNGKSLFAGPVAAGG